MRYVDADFYANIYLDGTEPTIPLTAFAFWALRAQEVIDNVTFDRLADADDPDEIPDKVKLCVCALAETLYAAAQAEKSAAENADYYTPAGVTYNGAKQTAKNGAEEQQAAQSAQMGIIHKYLDNTGLLYRGVSTWR